jgi:FkbH-like protein
VSTPDAAVDAVDTARALDADANYSATARVDRRLLGLTADERARRLPTRLAVVVGGNANVDFAVPGLRVQLAADGIDLQVRSTAYQGWVGEALAGAEPGDAWVVWCSSAGATHAGTRPPVDDVADVVAASRALTARGVTVVVVLPDLTPADDDPFSATARWRRAAAARLDHELPPEVVRLPVEHLQRRVEPRRWEAGRYWDSAKSPVHPDAATLVGREVARVLAAVLRPRVKAVAVDLDGTLWGGIVGDDGVEGLVLDPDHGGRPFLQLQRFLLDVSATGVPIFVVSKNDPDVASRAFRERSEMLLSLDDLVAFEVSWRSKHEAIARVAERLNIGLDAICFLDDSPHERLEATTFLPGLIVPELADDPEHRLEQLTRSGLFLRPVLTDDDRARVGFYQRALAEPVADVPIDHAAYLAGLDMVLEPEPVSDANLARVVSLLHKTNQFNLTTRRHSSAHVAAFAADPANYAWAFRLRDRLGDAGIVSVVLGQRADDALEIDTWLMSCRVFNRGVEHAVADHLATWCGAHGVASVRGRYEPTAKNGLVADFYDELGLAVVPGDDGGRDFAGPLRPPTHHLTITTGSEPCPSNR